MTEPTIDSDQRFERIRHRLAVLRNEWSRKVRWWARTPKKKAFGVEKHSFALHDPLTDAELVEYEQRYKVELPHDYRLFLQQLGDGGAGPYYGIRSIYFGLVVIDEEGDQRWLRQECPLRDGLPARYPDWIIAIGGAKWEERVEHGEWHPYQGSLTVCEVGCGYYYVLPLSGPKRGRVCGVDGSFFDAPLFPPYESFVDWYEAWLDAIFNGQEELFYS